MPGQWLAAASAPVVWGVGWHSPAQAWFSQQQRNGCCSAAKSGTGSCWLTFYFGSTGWFQSRVRANCALMWNVKGYSQRQINSAHYQAELSSTRLSVAFECSCGYAVCSVQVCATVAKHRLLLLRVTVSLRDGRHGHETSYRKASAWAQCHLPLETGGHLCPKELHCPPGLPKRKEEDGEEPLPQWGGSSTLWLSGVFPLEERRGIVTICRQQPQASGIKFQSKKLGPWKRLILGYGTAPGFGTAGGKQQTRCNAQTWSNNWAVPTTLDIKQDKAVL